MKFFSRVIRTAPQLLSTLGMIGFLRYVVFVPLAETLFRTRWASYDLNSRASRVTIRTNSSDRMVFDQIFATGEYAPIVGLSRVERILDLGGNCGISALWFLEQFPDATLCVVEPDPRNIVALRRNLMPYQSRCTIVEGAVWSEDTKLSLRFGTDPANEWATAVEASGGSEERNVEAYSIHSLLKRWGARGVDILKMDIEGAEMQVLPSVAQWSDVARCVAVELHGTAAVRLATDRFPATDWRHVDSGEIRIFFRSGSAIG